MTVLNRVDLRTAAQLKLQMLQLEKIALLKAAKTGFWRYIKRVAELLELNERSTEYEMIFDQLLAEKSSS